MGESHAREVRIRRVFHDAGALYFFIFKRLAENMLIMIVEQEAPHIYLFIYCTYKFALTERNKTYNRKGNAV